MSKRRLSYRRKDGRRRGERIHHDSGGGHLDEAPSARALRIVIKRATSQRLREN